MKASRVFWFGVLLSASLGCGGESTVAPDAGAGLDSGEARDASTVFDSEVPSDAAAQDGAQGDAAPQDDASTLADASAVDATLDAGLDASSSIDGGIADPYDTCDQALDVTAGGTFTGESTEAATNDYAPTGGSCPRGGAASGRDRSYVVQPTVDTMYRVRVTPTTTSFDPMLYAVETCGSAGCVAGTVFNGAGEIEEIEFTVNAGQVVYIIVDGEVGTSGVYDLVVTVL